MPFKSGIEATRGDRQASTRRAVMVMCSALGQEALVMEAIEAGASDFIVKPFKSEDVALGREEGPGRAPESRGREGPR